MVSLFRRATKFVASVSLNPAENRLTEVFASVLERVHWLPAAFLRFLEPSYVLDPSEWRARIRTQRPTLSGGFVDLEVELVKRARADERSNQRSDEAVLNRILCWIEVKHGAAVSGSQIETYVRDIQMEGAGHTVISLLVPRDFADRDREVPVFEWQDWARELRKLRHQHRFDGDEVVAWLVGEFLQYLKEEELMDDERFTIDHAYVMSLAPRTHPGFARIWEVVATRLAPKWGKPIGRSNNDSVLNMFRTYPIVREGATLPETWHQAWLEWGQRSDRFREDDSRSAVVFFAGLSSYAKESPFKIPANASWVASLEGQGLLRNDSEGYPRAWRLRYADELLHHASLEDAAHDMAQWVDEAFSRATASVPPA